MEIFVSLRKINSSKGHSVIFIICFNFYGKHKCANRKKGKKGKNRNGQTGKRKRNKDLYQTLIH